MNLEETTGEVSNTEATGLQNEENNATSDIVNEQSPIAETAQQPSEVIGSEIDAVEEETQEEVWSFDGWTKEALFSELQTIKTESVIKAPKNKLKDLKIAFDTIFREEKKVAYDQFIEAGGEKDGFDYRDDLSTKFFDLNKEISELRKKHRVQQEEQRLENTRKKDFLLNQLREIIDGDEATNTHKKVQEIQNTWKETGAVTQQSFREQNANYHGLLDRYYSRRSIYFELKDLDRKKNEEKKNAVIDQVEELLKVENTLDAVKQLNDLHALYKSIGPVPQEKSEPMWEKLKAVTDKVRARRDEFMKEYQLVLDANLVKKQALVEKVTPYAEKDSASISEWKAWTDELLQIQKEWKDVGPIPRDNKSDVSNNFWSLSRQFFNAKKAYFAKLDSEKEGNLKKKEELCAKVDAIKDAEDFVATANEIKRLQAVWKTIGRAPKSQNDKIYEKFRGLCDHFFNRRSAHFDARDSEYVENFTQKEAVVEKIKGLTKESTKEEFEALIAEYFAIGFVPRNKINEAQKSFNAATSKFIDGLEGLENNELQELKLSVELGSVKGTAQEADFKRNKVSGIRKKIGGINDEISTYKNNLEFFAHSKNIDQLRADVDQKVEKLEVELGNLKEQLKLLR